MKKSTLFAFAAALVMGTQIASAQQSQEVTYVEDTNQEYLFNSMKDNWFVTAEAGVSLHCTSSDFKLPFRKHIAPAASLYIGKWFSPIFGGRFGVTYFGNRSLTPDPTDALINKPTIDGYYQRHFNHVGPVFDVMLNLSNWLGGYNPKRFYNATVYVGAGGYFTLERDVTYDAKTGKFHRTGYKNRQDNVISLRAGFLSQFRLSDRWQLNLDLRYVAVDDIEIERSGNNRTANVGQVFVGATYNFGRKIVWTPPVVPICPEPENCDALRARLEAADARITSLESQVQGYITRPVEKAVKVEKAAPLSTVYYPIGVSKLSKKDVNVLEAIAEVMKANPSKKYTLTGWADNYTGNDAINTRLRHERANNVEAQLVRFGVNKSQLSTTINAGNLCDLGEKYVALDRAVTIEEAK